MDELLYTQEDIDEWIRTCEELQERNRDLKQEIDEYKDKIEQGTLIELPCKVGDSFYSYEGFKYQCFGIEIAKDGIYLRTVYDMKFLFGKEAFLTPEEAKKLLLELQGETKL